MCCNNIFNYNNMYRVCGIISVHLWRMKIEDHGWIGKCFEFWVVSCDQYFFFRLWRNPNGQKGDDWWCQFRRASEEQKLMPRLWIEHRASRSSVLRSPNWAIEACWQIKPHQHIYSLFYEAKQFQHSQLLFSVFANNYARMVLLAAARTERTPTLDPSRWP